MGAQLNAYLMSEDARSQANFYVEALGGEIVSVITFGQTPGTPEAMKDKVMHSTVKLAGENTVMISDSFDKVSSNRSISLALSFTDESEARNAFAKLAEGGEIKFPLTLQPWGAHYGEIVDKFGVNWMITQQ